MWITTRQRWIKTRQATVLKRGIGQTQSNTLSAGMNTIGNSGKTPIFVLDLTYFFEVLCRTQYFFNPWFKIVGICNKTAL